MKKYSLQDMRQLAKAKKGKCLSKKYVAIDKHLRWQCGCGNKFIATPAKIIHRGQWCPLCGIKKRARSQASSIEECRSIASARRGKCLSKNYSNNNTPLRWECEFGHRWPAPLNVVKGSKNRKGTWCPKCNGRSPRNISFARSVAKELGWKCLSSRYVNYNEKLDWKCSEGHLFSQSLAKVVSRKSCPRCFTYFGEELCRFYFESIFKRKFPKSKPEFLRVRKGVLRELDGYCEELGVAFEHQGVQHFRVVTKFHKSQRDLLKGQAEDAEKRKLCKQNGVKLIEIPAIPELLSVRDLPNKIVSELTKSKIKFIRANIPTSIDYLYRSKNSRIQLLKSVAEERGGKLLSKVYHGGRVHLRWRCGKGHPWSATPENILGSAGKKGTWCPECAKSTRQDGKRLTIQDAQEDARKRGGLCLSNEIIDSQTKLTWQCEKGHSWDAVPNSIRQGSWCPYCSGSIVTLDGLKIWAEGYRGTCLSKRYENNTRPIKWGCRRGHAWTMSLSKMQRRLARSKFWCLDCKKLDSAL